MDWKAVIDRYYPSDSKVRDILLRHSRSVADLAVEISHRKGLGLSDSDIEAAAMLHDIGIIATDAPGIGCHGKSPYMAHGIIGADMLREEGVDEKFARIAERHTGAGLTHEEIAETGMPLPLDRQYMPESMLEKLICYADCFYSKSGDMTQKSIDRVRFSMAKFGPGVTSRFEDLHRLFS